MGGPSHPSIPLKEFVKLYEKYGGVKAISRATGKPWGGVQASYKAAVSEGLMDAVKLGHKSNDHVTQVVKGTLKAKREPVIEGRLKARKALVLPRRKKGVTRFLFTSAQSNTLLFDACWDNLLALAKHYKATLHVSRFAYIKAGLGARGDKKDWFKNLNTENNPGIPKEDFKAVKALWWDERLTPYLLDERAEVAPGLVFCGEMNILPTKAKPLSGYQVYTGRKSGIFPHVKIAMESVATMRDHATKFNYTTGTVTMRNYIARDAGLKAEFHHCYGALLVEVNEDGDWWCRQINADSEGTLYDLDMCAHNGKIGTGRGFVHSFNPGDTHAWNIDPEVFEALWGEGGLVDTLRPKHQFHNDLLDFEPRSHHNIKKPHMQFLYHVRGREGVKQELLSTASLVEKTLRPWMTTHIVDSNHDRHIARWLEEEDGRRDPVNALFWSNLNNETYEFINKHHDEPNHFELAMRMVAPSVAKKLDFIPQDGSYIICPDAGGGIECGMHGDRGANGARGSAMSIAKMGRKANIGHSHSACIIDGVYQAGTCSIMKLSYNHGASSWSQSHIITYVNGKRAIICTWRGKWRA